MLSPQVQALLRSLQMNTFKALQSPLAGDYQTARKGLGVEFFQLREYQQGDDIRFIDWKSSLRSNRMMVKECIEQKQQTIVLLLDISPSSWYGSAQLRFDVYQKIAAIIAYATIYHNDRIALIAFAQKVELHIKPQSGMQGIARMLDSLFSLQAAKTASTSLLDAVVFAQSNYHRHGIFILLSDCIAPDTSLALARLVSQEDAFIILLDDAQERSFSYPGLLRVKDIESEKQIDIAFAKNELAPLLKERQTAISSICTRFGGQLLRLDLASPDVAQDVTLVKILISFFLRSMTRVLSA